MRENKIDAFRKNKASFVLSASRTTECRRLVRDAIASTLHVLSETMIAWLTSFSLMERLADERAICRRHIWKSGCA
jgi:hypothetical protein